MEKIKVYSTKTCPYCISAKNYFNENNIPFEDIDVSDNEKAQQEMIKKSGQMGVPVIQIGEKIIVGFEQEEIEEIISAKNNKNKR